MGNNKNSNEVIAKNILIRSGLKDINSYVGHDVDINDLNTVNLMCVFRDLVGIDPMYALEFIDLVNSMNVLSAYNFINKFHVFANNGFSTNNMSLVDENNNMNDIIVSAAIKAEFIKNTLEYAKKMQREYGSIVNNREVEVIKRGRKL